MAPERRGSRSRALWLRWLVGLTVAAALLAAYPLSIAPPAHRNSALLGWSISFVVCAASGLVAFWSLDHSMRGFLLATFGGMIARLVVIGGTVVVAVVVVRVSVAPFLIGLFGAYVVYQALEVIALHQGSARPPEARA